MEFVECVRVYCITRRAKDADNNDDDDDDAGKKASASSGKR